MKAFGKIINILLIAVLSVLLLFNVINIVGKTVFHNPLPHFFGYAVVSINKASGSMQGTLDAGEYFIIRREASYEVDDIITYSEDIGLVTHRIVEVNEDGSFVTKGDANNSIDTKAVSPDAVQGKFVRKLGGIGKVMNFITTLPGLLVLIVLAVLVLEGPNLLDSLKRKKQGGTTDVE